MYTKGNWTVNFETEYIESETPTIGKINIARFCVNSKMMNDEMVENAHLISAAPDMYEALKGFEIVQCERCDGSGLEPHTKEDACRECGGCGEVLRGGLPHDIKQALAKAEGK